MIKKQSFEKILNWEYWPAYMFYIPNIPYGIYLALKARSFTFYTATNPVIKSSGNGTESKFEVLSIIPERYKPKSILVDDKRDFDTILSQLKNQNINFPLIAKPDVGFRGLLVKKINTKNELRKYLEAYPIAIILQEYLDYKNECGVFYIRKPNEKKGKISSITLKKFLSVQGNGKKNLKELIQEDERAKLYFDLLEELHQNDFSKVIEKGRIIKLSVIGNHAKGTEFINGNHLISEQITNTFDKLSHYSKGWYYGRVDLKYNTFENLANGTDFKVIEVNGILAEPTHIYDSNKYTYGKALKTIRSHWKEMFHIAKINHKNFNIPYEKSFNFLNELITLKKYTTKIKTLTKKRSKF